MFNPHLIEALVADRERTVADHLRRRLVKQDRPIRWVRRPAKPIDRR
jgi:hypothetical protein